VHKLVETVFGMYERRGDAITSARADRDQRLERPVHVVVQQVGVGPVHVQDHRFDVLQHVMVLFHQLPENPHARLPISLPERGERGKFMAETAERQW